MKVDILAIGVHPDDVELSCAGTILKQISLGNTVAILDLTKGELGTRGNASLRTQEANAAAKILGVSIREQLDFKDGFFENNEAHQKEIIKQIRKFQPEIILCNAISDRHPDHGRASKLISDACFYSGLIKIETSLNGEGQSAWRPKVVYHYIQDHYIHPDFVVDITPFAEKKKEAIPDFMDEVFAKMRLFGRSIGAKYAEGFTVDRYPGVKNLFDLS